MDDYGVRCMYCGNWFQTGAHVCSEEKMEINRLLVACAKCNGEREFSSQTRVDLPDNLSTVIVATTVCTLCGGNGTVLAAVNRAYALGIAEGLRRG